MKWKAIVASVGALLLGAFVWMFAQTNTGSRPLAELVPAGALVYLEARDLSGLLKDWNASAEKRAWLASDNHKVFGQSRLLLRLTDAQTEFAQVAGLPPDMALVDGVAGRESALAIYDIGNLEFLYVTRLPQARAYESLLWQSRAKFQTRVSAGLTYYVKSDGRRTAAFAVSNGYLLLATREEAMAGALAIAAGQSRPSVRQERWFDETVKAARPEASDLRLIINFERVVRTAHFRSYWVQGNVSELRQYSAVLADLRQSAGEMREDRVLLRGEAAADRSGAESAVSQMAAMAPADAGLYRAWAAPSADDASALLQQKLFGGDAVDSGPRKLAPGAPPEDGTTGGEGDLETRIDEPALAEAGDDGKFELLRRAIGSGRLDGVMEVQSARAMPDGVFIDTPGAVVVLSAQAWNGTAVRDALKDAAARSWSVGGSGANWVDRNGISELNGLGRLAVSTNGRVLIAGTSADLVRAIAQARGANGPAAIYAARYRHARELPNFQKMTRLIDFPSLPAGSPREPAFFSENIAGLGRALGRVDTVEMEMHDRGAMVTQTVRYRLR